MGCHFHGTNYPTTLYRTICFRQLCIKLQTYFLYHARRIPHIFRRLIKFEYLFRVLCLLVAGRGGLLWVIYRWRRHYLGVSSSLFQRPEISFKTFLQQKFRITRISSVISSFIVPKNNLERTLSIICDFWGCVISTNIVVYMFWDFLVSFEIILHKIREWTSWHLQNPPKSPKMLSNMLTST